MSNKSNTLIEQSLHESERALSEAQRITHLGGWKIDLEGGGLFWTDEVFRIHELPIDEKPTVEQAISYYLPESRIAIEQAVKSAIENHTPFDLELQIKTAQGQIRCVHARGEARYMEGIARSISGTFQDITDRKQAEEELAHRTSLFEAIFRGIPDAIVYVNIDREVININPAFSEIFGFDINDLTGKKTSFFYESIEEYERQGRARYNLSADKKALPYEVIYRKKSGEIFPGETLGTTIKNTEDEIIGYIGIIRDISERKAAADEIEHLAFYDPLTDLPNRRLLLDRLEQSVSNRIRHKQHGALILLDIDNFKTLNDTLGHSVGDQFLVEVATRLRASVREGDTVARHGGDEFVLILENLNDDTLAAVQAEIVASKILRTLSQPYLLDLNADGELKSSHGYHCTSSIGIALFRDHSISAAELIKRADTAMYQAKANGRNALCFFDPEMQEVVIALASLEEDLHQAVRDDQFCLYYQPQVDVAGKCIGAEALIRWQHPDRGMVPPDEFIPLAENTGLILPIGQWVIETACAQLVAWERLPAMSQLTLAVNVSARQFHHKDFVEGILSTIRLTGADPAKLKLELTESLLLEDVEDIIAKMSALKDKGVSFSLDDFGTGYSSLSYLKRLPLDQLKIDRSFVMDVMTDPNDAAIARTIVALAKSMEMTVIAEGVETEEQREFLAHNGCTTYQGYLFSRPLPIEDFYSFLK